MYKMVGNRNDSRVEGQMTQIQHRSVEASVISNLKVV
jgi:hypothetical protein